MIASLGIGGSLPEAWAAVRECGNVGPLVAHHHVAGGDVARHVARMSRQRREFSIACRRFCSALRGDWNFRSDRRLESPVPATLAAAVDGSRGPPGDAAGARFDHGSISDGNGKRTDIRTR